MSRRARRRPANNTEGCGIQVRGGKLARFSLYPIFFVINAHCFNLSAWLGKLPTGQVSRGLSDVMGIVLIALGLVLLLAQISFERQDVAFNNFPPKQIPHNWVGQAGAAIAYYLFFLFGAGGVRPAVIGAVFRRGDACSNFSLISGAAGPGPVSLLICCIGLLDLYTNKVLVDKMSTQPGLTAGWMERLSFNLNTIGRRRSCGLPP